MSNEYVTSDLGEVEQKVTTIAGSPVDYHNFFYNPYDPKSLENQINDGWRVKFIMSNDVQYLGVVLFERKKRVGP